MGSIVLGIAGGTASGKTTVAEAVATALGDRCLLVSHDRYYLPLPDEYRHQPARWNFDHPKALETSRLVDDLDALLAGHEIVLPTYDFARHVRTPPTADDRVGPRPVVLVEGILVLAEPELRSRLDHAVFVHTPDDLRLMRRIERDIAERGRQLPEVLEQYRRSVRPMHEAFVAPSRQHATLVLDGTAPMAASVAAVLALSGLTG
ncbi:MAG: uridine kinase [Alphaproteobacteria bacterium]|nr:uridine kinase [Alphaproteobacteria bacterium]MCB9698170.1 uridine kinase [Alphaproteobacteria bacterium]